MEKSLRCFFDVDAFVGPCEWPVSGNQVAFFTHQVNRHSHNDMVGVMIIVALVMIVIF